MNAKKCDRCGAFFIPKNYIILRTKKVTEGNFDIFDTEYDLCEKCQKNFYEFLNKYMEVIKYEKK